MAVAVRPVIPSGYVAPAPRTSLDDVRRGAGSARPPARRVGGRAELDVVLAGLTQVVAWTSSEGAWQENATFLLRTVDDVWHAVGFADPAATPLVERLRELPDFDSEALLRLIGESGRRMITLWTRAPA